MAKHLLIVDDDALLRRSLAFNLEQAGYRIRSAAGAEAALEMARLERPDLVLLDINLPGMDGLDALRRFKEQLDLPVIFLTARRRELDEVVGLELGADDYVTKPFDVDVLLAHIKAVLRRVEAGAPRSKETALIAAGDLLIDPAAHSAQLAGAPLELSPREFDLLTALATQSGKVIRTEDLLDQVWGAEFAGQPQVVYVYIRGLRQKIELDPDRPERILTVRGVGYKLHPRDV